MIEPSAQRVSRTRAVIAAVTGLVLLLILAQVVEEPTPLAYFVFRCLVALCVAVVAAELPGSIGIELPGGIKAGGALAVFALVMWRNPAALVINPPIHLVNTSGDIGRVAATDFCPTSNPIEIVSDGSVRLGLLATTTSLRPQSASLVAEHRSKPSLAYRVVDTLNIDVGRSEVLHIPRWRSIAVTIQSVSNDNCRANYSLALTQ
ncbi:MAG TPA: hypothetical protein VJ717_20365 [Gemmatimonadaceae bacterium]|nr:hypothetical protein [Gemmatimonadaceae bacterium]